MKHTSEYCPQKEYSHESRNDGDWDRDLEILGVPRLLEKLGHWSAFTFFLFPAPFAYRVYTKGEPKRTLAVSKAPAA